MPCSFACQIYPANTIFDSFSPQKNALQASLNQPIKYDRRIIDKGAAWGVLVSLNDGTIGLMYQKAKTLSEVNSVNVSIEFVRSTDQGITWRKPTLVHERLGHDGKLFEITADSGFVVFQSRNIALGQLPSGRIICAFQLQNYHYTKDGKPIIVNDELQSNWDSKGIVYLWSDDLGASWTSGLKMAIDSYNAIVAPHWRIISLKDGTAIMSLYGQSDTGYNGNLNIPYGTRSMAGVIRSRDNGETWGDISLIMTKESPIPYEETALAITNKNLQAFVRTPIGNVVQYVSVDNGHLWKGPVAVTEPGQHPGGAIQLKSGNLLMTWGNRKYPYGAAAMLSYNGGLDWDHEHQVSLGWDSQGQNCGYANGIQLADSTILVTYYSMPPSIDYRSSWSESVVYLVRFTEDQFMSAVGFLNNLRPSPPEGLTATTINGQITLKWNKNKESDFLRYRIYGSNSSPATICTDSTNTGVSDTLKTFSSSYNTKHYFRVTAVDSAFNESKFSNELYVLMTLNKNNRILIYPNPTYNSATVSFNSPQRGIVTISLFNSIGQKIQDLYRANIQENSEQQIQFSLDHLPTGIYFVKLQCPDGNYTAKLQKINITK